MAPASNEEQFKFLISCIRWSNSGKVDFGEVAKECNIVSKGAAAKRYERMMKAHGIAPNAASVRASPAARAFKTERRESATVSKKRKVDDFTNDHGGAEDDQEHFDNVKPDPENTSEGFHVKEEPGLLHNGPGEGSMAFFPSMSAGSQGYLSTNNIYDYNSVGFNTNTGHATMYGLPSRPSFMPFNGYEQPNVNGTEATASQGGDHQLGDSQQASIMIGD